jgi:hypothetical protein
VGHKAVHVPALTMTADSPLRDRAPHLPALHETFSNSLNGTAGNLAMARALAAHHVHAKLTVSQPGDPDEEEADRVADAVVSRSAIPTIQRKCDACADGKPCGKCEEEDVHAKREARGSAVPAHLVGRAVNVVNSGGVPLPGSLRATYEPRFGRDLSSVKLHLGAEAGASARAIGARAYTVGQNIAFAPGEYQPGDRDGQRLLAHELTHVAQDSVGPTDQSSRIGRDLRVARDTAPTKTLTPGPPPESAPVPAITPQYRNTKVATWTGFVDTSVRSDQLLGEVAISRYAEPIGAIPVSITRPGWTPGHYATEAAALAAIGAAGTPGAVFTESGQFTAYHAHGDGMIYDFTYDNVRWYAGKPWTAVRFDVPEAKVLVTNDGATIRPEQYKTKEEAKATAADQALMPGQTDPFAGFLALGDPNTPGALELIFHPAMKANALSVLSSGRVNVEREIERRFSSGVIPQAEIELMRHTAEYLAGLDDEIDRIPKTIPPDPDHLASFNALQQRRRVVLARYPMLARVDTRAFIKLSPEEQNEMLGSHSQKVLQDIDTTRDDIISGTLNLWKIKPLVQSTLAGLGITRPDLRKRIFDFAEANESSVTETILQVFAIVFGLGSVFVTGPLGLAMAAGAFGLGVADAIRQTEEMMAESTAANTALDPRASLFSPDDVRSMAWLVIAWIGVVADGAQVVAAVRAVRAAGGAIDAGVRVLAKEDGQLASQLRLAAGAVDAKEVITSANKAGLANRIGTSIEIDARLGKQIEVHYSLDSRGRIVLGGVRCGPEATAGEILAHAPVVRMLRRYDGLIGRLRELIDRLLSLAGVALPGVNPFKIGSQAFESFGELTKLDEIIRLRQGALSRAIGTESEAIIRRDIEFLESELARHQIVVEQMTAEAGLGYISRAEEQTAKAISEGMPPLEGHVPDPTKYYYRINPSPPPSYTLTRFANANVPPRTLVPDGAGGWRIAEGALSRAEQATALVGGWKAKIQEAFRAVENAFSGKGVYRVVPLQGVASTGKTVRQLIDASKQEELFDILVKTFRVAGDPDPTARAIKGLNTLLDHEITIVRGTDQLRAFNYRLAFESGMGREASGDLHHLIPLYLGGDNRLLLEMNPVTHGQLHALIDTIPIEAGASLAPSSVLGSSSFNFAEGAAVLRSDGSVQLIRLNADGTFSLVP